MTGFRYFLTEEREGCSHRSLKKWGGRKIQAEAFCSRGVYLTKLRKRIFPRSGKLVENVAGSIFGKWYLAK